MADAGVQVSSRRSIQFVSLDTHPASNALVVTYEILVSMIDTAHSMRELSRRNKRAQMRIHLRQLDQLQETSIDLGRICGEIIQKCPLLMAANLEDIQLHLLYLINRRQSSLLAEPSSARPASSASTTRFARPGRLHSAAAAGRNSDQAADIYTYVRLLEVRGRACCFDLDRFERQFNARLDSIEDAHRDIIGQLSKLESDYLEGLYGNRTERFASLVVVRRLSCSRLAELASNRLLICALMRILRDNNHDEEYNSREFILNFLLRLTSYEDIYLSLADNSSPEVDLLKILCDLLAHHLKTSTAKSAAPETVLGDSAGESYHYLCAVLVVLINLFKLNIKLEERIIKTSLGSILCDLFQANAKDLMREIRLMGKPIKIIQLLEANLILLRQISASSMLQKEFGQQIRGKNQFLASLVNLLNCVQLSRPGSGNNNQQQVLVRDGETLNELYHLELNLLMLVNNLLADPLSGPIKVKLIKKELLKPVLRNLVIFLAASSSSSSSSSGTGAGAGSGNLDAGSSSLILMVPFRSLYELSCDKSVRLELYKSMIIMKCLLEYLLTTLMSNNNQDSNDWLPADSNQLFQVEPRQVSHYILSVWLNLTSIGEAPIFSASATDDDFELRDLLVEYLELLMDKLLTCREHLSGYLHLKLLRNISQYFTFEPEDDQHERLLSKLSQLGDDLMTSFVSSNEQLKPQLVECLACLSNLIKVATCQQEDRQVLPAGLASILAQLLRLKCENFHGEDDDDLLLVAIQLIGFLANKYELCSLAEDQESINQEATSDDDDHTTGRQRIYGKILRACNFVLDSKLNDYELIIHTLYSLSQLMNHAHFLKSLLSCNPNDRDSDDYVDDGGDYEDERSNLSQPAELLVNRLANLVLHTPAGGAASTATKPQQPQVAAGAQVIPRLALELLNIFIQLERQTVGGGGESQFVHKIRFANYNGKWLAAIQSSRREALESPSTFAGGAAAGGELGRVVARSSPPPAASVWFSGGGGGGDFVSPEDDRFPEQLLEDVEEEEQIEEDISKADNLSMSDDDEAEEAPDLNVIDPKSMIKHLSSRRQLRRMQQQQH